MPTCRIIGNSTVFYLRRPRHSSAFPSRLARSTLPWKKVEAETEKDEKSYVIKGKKGLTPEKVLGGYWVFSGKPLIDD